MPIFIPDLIPDTNVENTLSHGWHIFSHDIYTGFGGTGYGIRDPQGRAHYFTPSEVLRACSVARMAGGLFLDRLCIGKDGKKIIPLVEGTALYDEAVANTRQMMDPIQINDLVPGMIYVSDKNEKFLWLGEVHIRNLVVRNWKITPEDTKGLVRLVIRGNGRFEAKITKKIHAVTIVGPGDMPAWPTIKMECGKNNITHAIISDTPFPAPSLHCDITQQHYDHYHDGEYCYFRQRGDYQWYRIEDDLTVARREVSYFEHNSMKRVFLSVKSGEWEQVIERIK